MTPSFRRRATGPVALLGLLCVLLVVLGTLQYRWSGELSAAERTRMRAGAQARADAFARELDREVTRVFLRLSIDQDALSRRDFTRFAGRYDAWRARAERPALVSDVFLVEAADGTPRVSRYSREGRTFADGEWPQRLGAVLDRVGPWARPATDDGRPARSGPIGCAADGTPMVTVPVFPGEPASWRAGGRAQPVRFRPTAALVVVLDADVLRSQLLPDLAARHFGGADGLEYNLVVARAEEPRAVVWSSAALGHGPGDAETGLLELRPEEASDEDVRDLLAPRRVIAGEAGAVVAGGGPGTARGPMTWTFARRFDTGGERHLSLHTQRPGLWHLSATHRAGSLDAVVAAARRRNLTVSFGILLLLGASGAFLVASARRAERLARRQIEFVAGVTHELRTPLAVIRSAGENLADGLVDRGDDVRNYGALVRDEGRRLTEMVEQALALAGAESGRQTSPRQPLDVGRLVRTAVADWRASVADANVSTEEDVDADLPRVMGDEGALVRVVRNLLDNALKYGGDAGWVGVRTQTADGGRSVALVVEDRGPGVPADEREHIFEPFFRGRDATARRVRGSGLGLSLVRRIVESHGGRVTVSGRGDGGSAFTVTFPGLAGAEAQEVEA